jgi:hypothetical protein
MGGELHVTGVPGMQTPARHVSEPLQWSPSSQSDPSAAATWLTTPVAGAQLSVVQALPSSTTVAVPGVQVPLPSHTSPVVQALPSLHGVFFASLA